MNANTHTAQRWKAGAQTMAEAAQALKERIEADAGKERKFATGVRAPYTGPCSPDCLICSGVGWVRADLEPWHPDFGKLEPCPNANPDKLRKVQSRSGLFWDEQLTASWSDVLALNASTTQAARNVQSILQRGYGLVVLLGGYGIGKSLILKIAVAEALRAGSVARYALAGDLLDYLRQAYNASDHNAPDVIERLDALSTCQVLAVDELGRISETGWAKEKIFQLIDRRHVASIRQESVTLIALNDNQWGSVDEALRDRFSDSRNLIIRVDGDSARPIMPEGVRY